MIGDAAYASDAHHLCIMLLPASDRNFLAIIRYKEKRSRLWPELTDSMLVSPDTCLNFVMDQ